MEAIDVEHLMELDQPVRSGSLRTFGCWFGRPGDNHHVSIQASFDGEVLKIDFDDDETLEVWNPTEIVVDGMLLRITKATKVRWSWYWYGRPKSQQTLMYREYYVEGGIVRSRTNSLWPTTNPIVTEAAVELW